MQLRITHETRYDYAPPVEVAQHIACLRPRDMLCQRLLSHRLTVLPTPSQSRTAEDAFGNTRCFISLQVPHDQLRLEAVSLVETLPALPPEPDIPWEQVREHYRYRADGVFDPDTEFVFASTHVSRHADFAAYALTSFQPGAPLIASCTDLMQRIHGDFEYNPQSTEIHTPALEALAQRKGVCQDFAHIMLACLRSLGLAARYMSGYLLTEPAPGKPRLVGQDASHAWVSVPHPGIEAQTRWHDFDPTNNRHGRGSPGEDYVVLALGRDYADISPIRGVILGGASHELAVAVTVAPLDETTPETAPS